MKSTLSLITVSLTALFIIPTICNVATKPLLDKLFPKKETKKNIKQPLPQNNITKPNFQGYTTPYHFKNFYNSGIKIGGV